MQQAYFTADNPRRLDCLSKKSAGAADNIQDGSDLFKWSSWTEFIIKLVTDSSAFPTVACQLGIGENDLGPE